jgi:hypothetical protein
MTTGRINQVTIVCLERLTTLLSGAEEFTKLRGRRALWPAQLTSSPGKPGD